MYLFRKKKKDTSALKVITIILAVIGGLVAAYAVASLLYKKYKDCIASFNSDELDEFDEEYLCDDCCSDCEVEIEAEDELIPDAE